MLRIIIFSITFCLMLSASESELILSQPGKIYLFALEEQEPGVIICNFNDATTTMYGAKLNLSLEASEILKEPINTNYDPRWHLCPPLDYSEQQPKKYSIEQIAELIKNKQCAFYSGAGLSKAANIPVMSELYKSLQTHQDNVIDVCAGFFHALKTASPTSGHIALQSIATKKTFSIYTENLDTLHEMAGSSPVRLEHQGNRQTPSKKMLEEYDAIICVGLSRDWRGLLSFYKQVRPDGQIISIDLMLPNYLSDHDGWLEGDLQQILPSLEQLVNTYDKAPSI